MCSLCGLLARCESWRYAARVSPPNAPELSQLEEQADQVLDVTGLDCPLPVLRARMALTEVRSGQCLLVLATDPHSVVDFQAFCARAGHALKASGQLGQTFHFLLEKAPDTPKT